MTEQQYQRLWRARPWRSIHHLRLTPRELISLGFTKAQIPYLITMRQMVLKGELGGHSDGDV